YCSYLRSVPLVLFFLLLLPPPRSTLFPYTTLFRFSIMHAELLLGDSRFLLVDEFPGAAWSPASLGGSSVTLHLYVEDVDMQCHRSEEHTSELQSLAYLVCRLLLEKKKIESW